MTRMIPFLVALIVIATGCADTNEPSADTQPSTTRSTTPTASAAPEASVTDFTSVVAEHHADWDQQVATTEEHCLHPLTIPACMLGYRTLGLKAETIRLALTAVHKPSAPVYMGTPPEKIKDLLTETESAADAVALAAEAFMATGCGDPYEATCIAEHIRLDSAIGQLSRKLDAWSVY